MKKNKRQLMPEKEYNKILDKINKTLSKKNTINFDDIINAISNINDIDFFKTFFVISLIKNAAKKTKN